jgi:hypothetical protein
MRDAARVEPRGRPSVDRSRPLLRRAATRDRSAPTADRVAHRGDREEASKKPNRVSWPVVSPEPVRAGGPLRIRELVRHVRDDIARAGREPWPAMSMPTIAQPRDERLGKRQQLIATRAEARLTISG